MKEYEQMEFDFETFTNNIDKCRAEAYGTHPLDDVRTECKLESNKPSVSGTYSSIFPGDVFDDGACTILPGDMVYSGSAPQPIYIDFSEYPNDVVKDAVECSCGLWSVDATRMNGHSSYCAVKEWPRG